MQNTPAEQGEGVDNQLNGCGDNPTRNPEKSNGAKAQYTPVATIFSSRGKMLRISAVNGGMPSVSVELRKGVDPFAKPCAKIVISLDLLTTVLLSMAEAGDLADQIDKASEAEADG